MPDIQMSNVRAKELLPYENPDECCYSCRHYHEDPDTGEADCLKLHIRTICIALCNRWERKVNCGEA